MIESFVYVYFFFFKQKTAYEVRISDWSSDVCSSDLDSANTVDEKLGNQYGDYARYAAEAIAGAATALDNKDIDDLVNEARDFVRKSPAVAIGAAAIAGFVLMRLVKPAKEIGRAHV